MTCTDAGAIGRRQSKEHAHDPTPPAADELAWLDATAQADLVRRGVLTPLELVEAAIARIERLDGELNAVTTTRFEKARREAREPAAPARRSTACRCCSRTSCATRRATRCTAVCAHCGTAAGPPPRTPTWPSGCARRVLFCGRTNLPELATSVTTEPLAYGATRNPWDLTRSPGLQRRLRGGGGVRHGPLAHGNDMAGSIRMPASACGWSG
ncbi:amidase family protein [Streptomyces sp. M19]